MRSKPTPVTMLAVCVLMLALAASAFGCGMPWSSSGAGSGEAVPIDRAVYQLQAAIGMADRAVTESLQPPLLAGSDVALRWVGGRADVDSTTGRIRAILVDQSTTATETSVDPDSSKILSNSVLDEEAQRTIGFLGWDAATLEAEGFTAGKGQTISYFQVGTIYEKTWVGHDSAGLPNDGVIQIGLDVTSGGLHSFLYEPGPVTAPDLSETITKEKAGKTAKDAVSKSSYLSVSTTVTTAKGTSTTLAGGVISAVLIHMSNSITQGKDMVVWVIKLAADPAAGKAAATVYVDAVNNKALSVQAS